MKTNYYINVFYELSNGEWKHCDTVQTKEVDWLVVKDGVLYSCGHIAPTNAKEALSNNGHRYFQIAKSEPITDYVIATMEICHFSTKISRLRNVLPQRWTIWVQLVNNQPPYYFVQRSGNWRWERTICSGQNMQEIKKGLKSYFNRSKFYFDNDEEQRKFEHLF